jgi:hypothetical protein
MVHSYKRGGGHQVKPEIETQEVVLNANGRQHQLQDEEEEAAAGYATENVVGRFSEAQHLDISGKERVQSQ